MKNIFEEKRNLKALMILLDAEKSMTFVVGGDVRDFHTMKCPSCNKTFVEHENSPGERNLDAYRGSATVRAKC